MNLDEYIQTVGDYADRIAKAEREAEQHSMDVARTMDEVYESGVWIAEWLEQKPEPKRPTARWNPADRNRFIAWQAWKLEQAQRRHLDRTRSWRLMEAAAVCKICATGTDLAPTSEATFRPLFWVRKNRYENRLPEVWAIAVELAGGDPKAVTAKHTKEALAKWKHDTFGTRRDGTPRKTPAAIAAAANAAGKANRLHAIAMETVREMYRLATLDERARDEFEGFLEDLDTFLDEHTVSVKGAA